jgi:hypothetical protein
MTKTAQVVNALIENFDYDKFVKENKEEMNKMYRVPLGGSYVMGDTTSTNAKYIQKRAKWIKSNPDDFLVKFWESDIIGLIRRINAGNKTKATDLNEEKRQKLAVEGFIG